LVWGKDTWAQAYNKKPLSCPNIFVGMVVRVTDPKTPFNSGSKASVYFEVMKKVRGTLGITPLIRVESRTEHEFISGETYLIGIAGDKICSLRQLTD
jgi:hypothetical protein